MTGQSSAFEHDPRLTSFVLGELDEDEAAVIEKRLETDEQLRQTVDAIRRTVVTVSEGLQAEAAPALTEEQRQAIQREAEAADAPPVIFTVRRMWIGTGLAAAACVALALILPMVLRTGSPSQSNEFAIGDNKPGQELRTAPPAPTSAITAGEKSGDGQLARAQSEDRPAESGSNVHELLALEVTEPQNDLADAVSREVEESLGLGAPGSDRSGGAAAKSPPAELRDTQPAQLPGPDGAAGLSGGAESPPRAPGRSQEPSAGGQGGARGDREPVPGRGRRHPPRSGRMAPGSGLGAGTSGGAVRETSATQFGGEDSRWAAGRWSGRTESDHSREGYELIVDNPFRRVSADPALMPTFSIDVDTASYSNVRRFINTHNQLPPPDAVRIEELLNYFSFGDPPPPPDSEEPFAVNVEVGPCPWKEPHRLMRVGLKGREVAADMRPATNLVFLLDTSGSMSPPNKLPLVKKSIRMLLEHLTPDDRVALVVYAGSAGVVQDSIYCQDREIFIDALDHLKSGGSTAGGEGIELAYKVASDNFIEGGVNRVLLCTDGDFNVGVSSDADLVRLIEEKRQTGVFLSVLGFGEGNWQDAKMEKITNAGNGNFAYIDSVDEARKVLVEEMGGTLVAIAKDVKIQVDFNPAKVQAYRLIGYENRILDAVDFADDTKDAGEIGAGHSVTALFEVVPKGVEIELPEVDQSKYATEEDREAASGEAAAEESDAEVSDELLEVRLRHKQPAGDESVERRYPVPDREATLDETSDDFRFAAGVACFGMILRDSPYKSDSTYELAFDLALSGAGENPAVYFEDFLHYVRIAQPELAHANGIALLNTGLTEEELAMVPRKRGLSDEEVDRALEMAAQIEETQDVAAELAPRIRRGRANLPADMKITPFVNHRLRFIELVNKARAIQSE